MKIDKSDLLSIKGIGEAKVSLLSKLGIGSVDALLHYFPREYKDYSKITPISEVRPDTTVNIRGCITGEVKTETLFRKPISRSTFKVKDDTGSMSVTIFHKKQLPFYLKRDTEYVFSGKTEGTLFDPVLSSPTVISKTDSKIQPVYPLKNGISSKQISHLVECALKEYQPVDILPEQLRKKYNLCDIDFALSNIHLPISMIAKEAATKRLIFEELFVLQTAFATLKSKTKEESAIKLQKDYTDEFISRLPFTPTNAQVKVIKECIADIKSGIPMNRLIQGDVGCGKTAVAAALCYTIAKNGYQAAIMAPTEILAKQHFNTFNTFLKDMGINCQLFTGSMTPKQKRESRESLINGEIQIAIGTHALISEGVDFNNLGLVITDEQHRFGVAQRAKLSSKGNLPHRLVMSATPIPRTLALIVYGDLDISIIDEYPKNRQTIDSFTTNSKNRDKIYNFIKAEIDSGRQCYIVCPLVEENDTALISAEEYYEEISKGSFNNYKVGILHGKMKASDKETVMSSFLSGDIDLLVCTTVVEVGVDVPNATVMVIENAERFGMSQLHQLRGRIGRGKYKSTCIFVSDSTKNERIKIMCETSDGFKIAEEDLKMRGPGDFIGKRQHGLPEFKIADLGTDMTLMKLSNVAANEIIKESPDLEKFPLLKEAVYQLLKNSDN